MKTDKSKLEAPNKQLDIPVVMLRLNEKLEEYKVKRDKAKAICDKQKKYDTSFQAEVEDEIFLLASRQYQAIKDLYDYVTNAT